MRRVRVIGWFASSTGSPAITGIEWGPTFRGVQEVWASSGEALVQATATVVALRDSPS